MTSIGRRSKIRLHTLCPGRGTILKTARQFTDRANSAAYQFAIVYFPGDALPYVQDYFSPDTFRNCNLPFAGNG